MKLSFLQVIFLGITFFFLFYINFSSFTSFTKSINSFLQNIKKSNSSQK